MKLTELLALVRRRDELQAELAEVDRALESVVQTDERAQAATEKRRETGRLAGLTTAARMTPEQRTARAKKAAETRWSKTVSATPTTGSLKGDT